MGQGSGYADTQALIRDVLANLGRQCRVPTNGDTRWREYRDAALRAIFRCQKDYIIETPFTEFVDSFEGGRRIACFTTRCGFDGVAILRKKRSNGSVDVVVIVHSGDLDELFAQIENLSRANYTVKLGVCLLGRPKRYMTIYPSAGDETRLQPTLSTP